MSEICSIHAAHKPATAGRFRPEADIGPQEAADHIEIRISQLLKSDLKSLNMSLLSMLESLTNAANSALTALPSPHSAIR